MAKHCQRLRKESSLSDADPGARARCPGSSGGVTRFPASAMHAATPTRPTRRTPMRIHCTRTATSCALAVACLSGAGSAQTPPTSPSGSVVVAKPTYTSIPMEITVNRPAAEVWKRIGKYCDVAEWLQIPAGCTITSGKDGEFGAVRTVGAEVLVSKTELSYTYAQTPKEGQPYNLYHGTLEARPLTATTSKIVYTLFFDNSMLPDAGARAADKARRTERFMQALQNMKILAEGGKLPSPAG